MSNIKVGDVFPQGRVVKVREEEPAYAWLERQCSDGTVEREAFWIHELRGEQGEGSGER